jgi:hypothetical protein
MSTKNGAVHLETNGTIGVAKFDAPKLLVWSAADGAGIPRIQNTWGPFFSNKSMDNKTPFLHNLAHTLATRRTHLPWRTFAIARPSDDLAALTERFSSACQSHESPNLAMIFSGVSMVPFGILCCVTDIVLARSPMVRHGT